LKLGIFAFMPIGFLQPTKINAFIVNLRLTM